MTLINRLQQTQPENLRLFKKSALESDTVQIGPVKTSKGKWFVMAQAKGSDDKYFIQPMGTSVRVLKNDNLIADRLFYGIKETDSSIDLASVIKKEMPFCGPMARKAIYGMLKEKEREVIYTDPAKNTPEATRKRALGRVGLSIAEDGRVFDMNANQMQNQSGRS